MSWRRPDPRLKITWSQEDDKHVGKPTKREKEILDEIADRLAESDLHEDDAPSTSPHMPEDDA